MAADECLIEFDQNEFGTYFAGELVSGKITITQREPKQLTAIYLEICGFARCQWQRKFFLNRTLSYENKHGKHIFRGSEDYFLWTQYLIGTQNGPTITIPASTLFFKFVFQLPTNCPASFQGTYGYVRYMVKVNFRRAGAFDRTIIKGLTILPLLDLNTEDPLLKLPTSNDTLEKMCFLGSRAINLCISIPRTAYVPGEVIVVSVKITNNSKFDCKYLIIKLNLCAKYTSNQWQSISEVITLVERKCCPVPSTESREIKEAIRIPATPPTSEHLSKILRISYDVQVVGNMGLLMMDPTTKIPITIGNVPYTDIISSLENSVAIISDDTISGNETEEDGINSRESQITETLASLRITDDSLDNQTSDIHLVRRTLPPSYEEAMHMRADISDRNMNVVAPVTPFVPHYPVFNEYPQMQLAPPTVLKKQGKKTRRKRQQKATTTPTCNAEQSYDERLV